MKHNETNERSINSYVKESDLSTLLEHRYSKIFHSIPSNVRESKWHGFVQEQLTDHAIAHVQDDIITAVIETVTEKQLYEKKLFEFTSECTREAWLRVLNASIHSQLFEFLPIPLTRGGYGSWWVSPKLDPYWRCDTSGRATHLIVDAESQPPPIDLWIFGNVEQTFLEKPPPLQTFVSTLKSAVTDKSPSADHDGKIVKQQRAKPKDTAKEKIEQKSRKKKTPSIVICELSTSLETSDQRKVSRYVGTSACTSSVPEKHISGDVPAKVKDKLSHVEEEKVDHVSRLKKQTVASPDVKKEELIIHRRRSTKDMRRNEVKISAQRESILQYQPSTDRVDILYTVLPEQISNQRRSSNILNLKRKK